MMRHTITIALLAGAAAASEWPRFRGPNGTGVSTDLNLPGEVDPGKNVVWKAATLKGNSSPIVIRGRVFLTGHEGDERLLLCYDAGTGKLLWRKGVTKARTEISHPRNGPTTPTTATDGNLLFVYLPEFGLIAYDFDAREKWRTPLGPFAAIQGMATSPVFIDGKVVLLVDTPDQAFLAAYDAASGKQAWSVERPTGFMGSYATPAIYKDSKGGTQLVVAGAVELTGYDPKNGKRLWWASGVTTAPAAPPLVTGDSVYTVEPVGDGAPEFGGMLKQFDKNGNKQIELSECSGSDLNSTIMGRVFRSIDKHIGNKDGAVSEEEFTRAFGSKEDAGGLVRLRLTGEGDVKRNVVWRHTKGLPYVTGPLLYQDVLYSVRDGGILSTFDPETGKLLREARVKDALGEYYASPVAGDGKVYLVNLDGKVSVLRAGADWEVISTGDLGEQVIATPAIADGRIYVRTEQTLWAFGKTSRAEADR